MAQRRRHSGAFKAKLVIEALKGARTINEIASHNGVHPIQLTQWKKQALEGLPRVFEDGGFRAARAGEEEKSRLYEQIGRLKVELEWVKKKGGLSD